MYAMHYNQMMQFYNPNHHPNSNVPPPFMNTNSNIPPPFMNTNSNVPPPFMNQPPFLPGTQTSGSNPFMPSAHSKNFQNPCMPTSNSYKQSQDPRDNRNMKR